MALLLMTPVVVVILIVVGYVYLTLNRAAPSGHVAASDQPTVAPSSSASPQGRWKNIATRAIDPRPLGIQELYPVKFAANGSTGTRTVARAGSKCARAVVGATLGDAVRKAGCTQVVRASYLSGNRKIMATIGVLNLVDAAAATRVGRASGPTDYIKALPSAHGPTHNLTRGNGLEEATVKGHYLILIWSEFANLHAPSNGKQRKELAKFAADLIAGTANRSLSSRMATGAPLSP